MPEVELPRPDGLHERAESRFSQAFMHAAHH
jgi:hypothetical protein